MTSSSAWQLEHGQCCKKWREEEEEGWLDEKWPMDHQQHITSPVRYNSVSESHRRSLESDRQATEASAPYLLFLHQTWVTTGERSEVRGGSQHMWGIMDKHCSHWRRRWEYGAGRKAETEWYTLIVLTKAHCVAVKKNTHAETCELETEGGPGPGWSPCFAGTGRTAVETCWKFRVARALPSDGWAASQLSQCCSCGPGLTPWSHLSDVVSGMHKCLCNIIKKKWLASRL